MIIDVHVHTSKHKLRGLHTADADIGDIQTWATQYGISRMYILATYFPLKRSGLHNEEMLRRIEGNPLFGCFGSLDMENNLVEGIQELEQLADQEKIEGIKLYPGYQNVSLSDLTLHPIFELARKFGLPIACHMGELHHCCSKEERTAGNYRCGADHCPLDVRSALAMPSELKAVAKKFPDVLFLASHLANPFFEELREAMSECGNIYTDISGQFLSASDEDTPEYRKFLASEITKFLHINNGVERVLFGTDFPIQSYRDTLELVNALNLNPAEKQMVLSENALRILPPRTRRKK